MARKTSCQTDGCIYGITICGSEVRVEVTTPYPVEKWCPADHIEILERNLHNAIELVLKPFLDVTLRPIAGFPYSKLHHPPSLDPTDQYE